VDELPRDLTRNQGRGGGLGEDAVDHAFGVERSSLAEVGHAAAVRTTRIEDARLLARVHRQTLIVVPGANRVWWRQLPARERFRALPHIILGVVARPHREQLHELARVVLVRVLAGRRGEVEVAKHGRVGRHLQKHRAQVCHRHPAPGEVLPVDESVVGRFAVVGREVAVPEERHPLGERRRRAEHVVEPPLLQLRDREAAAWRVRGRERRRLCRL